jgi:putative membrane protein
LRIEDALQSATLQTVDTGMPGDGWWWHMGWMWPFWIVVIILIVFLVQRASTSSQPPAESGVSAEEILKRRYARGEIGKEEYERKLEDLKK